jgi:hypothetical protein
VPTTENETIAARLKSWSMAFRPVPVRVPSSYRPVGWGA